MKSPHYILLKSLRKFDSIYFIYCSLPPPPYLKGHANKFNGTIPNYTITNLLTWILFFFFCVRFPKENFNAQNVKAI